MPENGASLTEPQLARLLDVGRALVSELDVESVLRQVLDTAQELTSATYAALGILDADKQELERFLHVGISEEMRREIGPLPRGRGVLGELIRNPAPLRLPDVTEHPRSYGFPPGHPPMKTFLGVPISIRGEAFGNLYLADKASGLDFDEADQELVLVLAEWAAIAIDNARLYESAQARRAELERAVRGLEATATIARAVGFETDLARVLELVVKRGRAVIEAGSVVVLLDVGGCLRAVAAAGERGDGVVGTELALDGTLAGSVLAGGAAELVADLNVRMGHGLEPIAGRARSALVVPLGFRGRGRGLLVALAGSDDPPFDADAEHLLTSFAASAAIAIATAQSVEAERRRHSIRASERERTRWARELHDETLQELGALKLLLETAERSGRAEMLERAVGTSVEQLDLSIRNLQGLITELRPAALDELGIEPALEALVKRVATTSGLEVNARVELAPVTAGGRLPSELESTIYRLVQEALTNAVKHSGADRADVEVAAAGDIVTVAVRDDGEGFEPGRTGEGFGLVGMHERVALVGGALEIDSAPGRGTTVSATLPAMTAGAGELGASDLRSVG
ncbi:MAG TPA: GAF domain-containing sensor histidine kinase [Thermoleophilaceae bacterium]|nr:GAF domain-containing sensor histidine kinase [Thermoleophilaceae bacterium]